MSANSDIEKIDDITILTELYIKEAKEANELSKKLELINERFIIIRDKITSLKHLYENKSEEREDLTENEPVEKVKKPKKTTKKVKEEVKEDVKEEVKEEEKLEIIEKEEEPKNKNKVKATKKTKEVKEEIVEVVTKKTTKKKKKDDD